MIDIVFINNNESLWETDFLTKTIFLGNKNVAIYNVLNYKFVNPKNNCVLVFNGGGNITAFEIMEFLKEFKPISVIYLSDEYGTDSKNVKMIEDTIKSTVYRQYNNYDVGKQIPLGCVSGFLNVNRPIKPINKRENIYSFVGTLKSDRVEMINAFKYLKPADIRITDTNWGRGPSGQLVKPEELFDIYNNSKFVICGRGNKSLDCFRIYEAILAGSVPVVVGPDEEIKNTFCYGDNPPMLISSTSWKFAALKCEKISDFDLDQIQKFNIQWIETICSSIRDDILSLNTL